MERLQNQAAFMHKMALQMSQNLCRGLSQRAECAEQAEADSEHQRRHHRAQRCHGGEGERNIHHQIGHRPCGQRARAHGEHRRDQPEPRIFQHIGPNRRVRVAPSVFRMTAS